MSRARLGVLGSLLALTLAAGRAGAQDPVPAPEASPSPAGDGRRTMSRLVPNLGRAAVGIFAKQSLWPLAIGSTATAIGSAYDEQLRDDIANPADKGSKAVSNSFGGLSAAAVVAVFAGGRLAHGERFRAASYDMLVAAAVNGAFTFGIKTAVGRERPDASNNQSFPSGHTSNAFALAAVLDGHYGKRVAIPAYLVASAVGASRLRLNKHWLSDVVAGSALGYIVGAATVRVNNKPLGPAATGRISVVPLLGQTKGLAVALDF